MVIVVALLLCTGVGLWFWVVVCCLVGGWIVRGTAMLEDCCCLAL